MQLKRNMFSQIRNTVSNTIQGCEVMNNIINSMDNSSNHPSNNHTICNTVENNTSTVMNTPNDSSTTTESNTAATSYTSTRTNSTSTEITLLNDTLNTSPLPIPTIQECLENIKNGIKPDIELHRHSETIKMQERFNELIFKHKMHHCKFCQK